VIELTDWLRRELARRADQEAPQEACGLISRAKPARGLPEGGIALWAAENASSDPEHHFAIDPDTLLGITKQIEARGETLVGVYHSHPGGVAAPSPEDVETAAQWPGLTWIIVGRGPCERCGGSGEVDATSGDEYTGAPCPDCEGSDPPGSAPVFWNGVLA